MSPHYSKGWFLARLVALGVIVWILAVGWHHSPASMPGLSTASVSSDTGSTAAAEISPVVDALSSSEDVLTDEARVLTGDWQVVARVIDGDTIELGGGERLRYIGIDTPENTTKIECYGAQATERNRVLVEGKSVRLEKDISERDRYNRLLRYVYLKDGTFVNRELVLEGYATVFTYPPDVIHAAEFLTAQVDARQALRGLWNGCQGAATTVAVDTTSDCPPERPIKGNRPSYIYHLPGQRYYAKTKPEECFATEEEAQGAGYRRAKI